MANGGIVSLFGVSAVLTWLGTGLAFYLTYRVSEEVLIDVLESFYGIGEHRAKEPSQVSSSHSRSMEQRKKGRTHRIHCVICMWMFTLFLLLRSMLSTFAFVELLKTNQSARSELDNISEQSGYRLINSFSLILIWFSYGEMAYITFDRVCTVFSNTMYKMNETVITVLKWTIIMVTVLTVFGFIVFYWVSPSIGGLLVIPGSIAYPSILCYSTFIFGKNTHEIAISMTSIAKMRGTVDSPSERTFSDAALKEKVRNLMDVSVRLTIVAFSVILSSLAVICLSVTFSLTQHPIAQFFLHLGTVFDSLVNLFSIMCVDRKFIAFYMSVYGSLHSHCLEKYTRFEQPADFAM